MTADTVTPRGISEKNRRLLTRLYRGVTGPFSVQDAIAVLSFDATRTQRFLAYLAERGWLVRVCRGLYAPVPLDAIDPGGWRVDPWVVASKLFGPGYYIGGWTACEHWNLTEQMFLDTVVITTRKVRSKEARVQGLPYRIRRAPGRRMFGTKPAWRDRTRVNVSDPSRTLVDILDAPSLGGGVRHVADIVDTYFREEHRDDRLLSTYIGLAGNRVVFKRLGYLLETLDVRAPALLRACETGISSGISRLDPSRPDAGPVAWRWNLRINAAVAVETAKDFAMRRHNVRGALSA